MHHPKNVLPTLAFEYPWSSFHLPSVCQQSEAPRVKHRPANHLFKPTRAFEDTCGRICVEPVEKIRWRENKGIKFAFLYVSMK
jgi:hypothetical protein